MKKFVLLVFIIFFVKYINAQNFIVSAKAGFALPSSVNCEAGIMLTGIIENRFNKYILLGINGKIGGVNYNSEKTILESNVISEERELDVLNNIFAINIFPKISFVNTADLNLSIAPEFGYYWVSSEPTIYFKNRVDLDVSSKNYDTNWSDKNFSLGLHLEGQYYLSDRTTILASIGWNNYDIGLALNTVDLVDDWDYKLNEKTNFIYCEIGITYLLFGKSTID